MAAAAELCARTKTSPDATVPDRLMVRPAAALPLKNTCTLYAPAPRFTEAPVPLKISRALLLLEPSTYSEKKSSVGAARTGNGTNGYIPRITASAQAMATRIIALLDTDMETSGRIGDEMVLRAGEGPSQGLQKMGEDSGGA